MSDRQPLAQGVFIWVPGYRGSKEEIQGGPPLDGKKMTLLPFSFYEPEMSHFFPGCGLKKKKKERRERKTISLTGRMAVSSVTFFFFFHNTAVTDSLDHLLLFEVATALHI